MTAGLTPKQPISFMVNQRGIRVCKANLLDVVMARGASVICILCFVKALSMLLGTIQRSTPITL